MHFFVSCKIILYFRLKARDHFEEMEQFKSKIVVLCSFCNSIYKVAIELEGKSVTCAKCNQAFIAETGSHTVKKDEDLDNTLLFCKIALNYGFINESQLEKVLNEYTSLNQSGSIQKIETLFSRSGFLDDKSISKIQEIVPKWWIRQKEKQYAATAVAKGLLTKEKAKEILIAQAKLYSETGQIKWVRDFMAEQENHVDSQNIGIEKTVNVDNPEVLQQNESIETTEIKKREDQETGKQEPDLKPIKTTEEIGANSDPSVVVEDKKSKTEVSTIQVAIDTKLETEKIEEPKKSSNMLSKAVSSTSVVEPQSPGIEIKKPDAIDEEVAETEKNSEEESLPAEDVPDVKPSEIKPIEDEEGQFVKTVNGLELTVSSDKVVALLKAPDGILPGTSVESIKQMLEEEGISNGIVDDALIKGFLNSKVFREKPFKIAEGKSAKIGSEGFVKYYFETNPLTVGAVSESGEIDFKDRGEIPYVKEGALLAEITPAVIGENGMDICGHLIEVPTINPIGLRPEEGTELSEDGLKVFAKNDGQPKLAIGDRLYVLSELKIPGDVGFETGHIEFDGNIVIGGTVQSDFTVKGANVTATEVLAAEIIATGDLTVVNGITGGKATVEGNVKAKFINRGDIRAYGNVVVERELIDSTIKTSGGCQVLKGKIIASEISAKQGIEAVEIGTELSVPSKFRIGVDDHINDEVSVLDAEIDQCQAFVEELKHKIETATEDEKKTHQTIADLAQLQDRTQLGVNALRVKIDDLKKAGNDTEAALLTKQSDELTAVIKKADDDVNSQFDSQDELIEVVAQHNDLLSSAVEKIGVLKHDKKSLLEWAKNQTTVSYIKTSSSMFSGTMVIGAHTSMVVKETAKNVKIREVKNPDMPEGWEMRRI